MRALGTLAAAATAATLGIGLSAAPAGAVVPLPEILPGVTPDLESTDALNLEDVDVDGSLDQLTGTTDRTVSGVTDASRQAVDETPAADVVGEATDELEDSGESDDPDADDSDVTGDVDDAVDGLGGTEDPLGDLGSVVDVILGGGVL